MVAPTAIDSHHQNPPRFQEVIHLSELGQAEKVRKAIIPAGRVVDPVEIP